MGARDPIVEYSKRSTGFRLAAQVVGFRYGGRCSGYAAAQLLIRVAHAVPWRGGFSWVRGVSFGARFVPASERVRWSRPLVSIVQQRASEVRSGMAKAPPAGMTARGVKRSRPRFERGQASPGAPSTASTEVGRANNSTTCYEPCERELCGLE